MNRETIKMLIIMGAQLVAAFIGSSPERKPEKEVKENVEAKHANTSIKHQ
jgi:hypothetical protein